uniref:Uncharacterized protein n=1 Tax=Parascaris equorum TaxID=6256 RepID=A0A914RFH7_PAREQ
MEALTAWLNYLLKGDCDDENFQESAVRSKAARRRPDEAEALNLGIFFAHAKMATYPTKCLEKCTRMNWSFMCMLIAHK